MPRKLDHQSTRGIQHRPLAGCGCGMDGHNLECNNTREVLAVCRSSCLRSFFFSRFTKPSGWFRGYHGDCLGHANLQAPRRLTRCGCVLPPFSRSRRARAGICATSRPCVPINWTSTLARAHWLPSANSSGTGSPEMASSLHPHL